MHFENDIEREYNYIGNDIYFSIPNDFKKNFNKFVVGMGFFFFFFFLGFVLSVMVLLPELFHPITNVSMYVSSLSR